MTGRAQWYGDEDAMEARVQAEWEAEQEGRLHEHQLAMADRENERTGGDL